ncbi:MAG: putative lipid II flippase FtsW [Oscillospiraceae bacterium]|jgi:cell division protein FtsW|nr:putative lipid II flippase FtsW [Oscillospiraceae bacterium]
MTAEPNNSVFAEDALPDYREKAAAGRIDFVFAGFTLLTLAVGLVMLLSASYARAFYEDNGSPLGIFIRQLGFSGLGVAAMFAIALFPKFNERFFEKWSPITFFASLILLAAVLVIGTSEGGGKRWINLGFMNLQPSELVKYTMVLYFARRMCSVGKKIGTISKGVAPYVGWLVVICGLLIAEPHVSACIIFIALTGCMMFQAGTRFRYIAILLILASIAAYGMYKTGFPSDYITERVIVYQDPWGDSKIAEDKGYQTRQSLIAVGSGGLLGLGLGQSRQKHLYLPEEHNDFIFAIVCEEFGLIGAIIVMLLFGILIARGYWLAIKSKSKFSALVIAGITTQLGIQVFLNISVVTNLIPCTGISLPLFSYGGSALLCQLGGMGIILALSRGTC